MPLMPSAKQIFILGAPRSGTTFTASLLSESDYGAPLETHLIPKYADAAGRVNLDDRNAFGALFDKIVRERPILQWELAFDAEDAFETLPSPRRYADIINYLFWVRAGRPENDFCWGDKTPWYIEALSLLRDLFPAAKFVYLVRDGRDVALSLLQKPWGPNNVWACATYWDKLNQRSPVIDDLVADGRLIKLFYEDLLEDPATYAQALHEFIDQPITDATRAQLGKTMRGNKEKWKTAMSESQIRTFEGVASASLIEHGYRLHYEPARAPNAVMRTSYYVQDRFRWLLFMFKQNVIDGILIRFFGKQPFAD